MHGVLSFQENICLLIDEESKCYVIPHVQTCSLIWQFTCMFIKQYYGVLMFVNVNHAYLNVYIIHVGLAKAKLVYLRKQSNLWKEIASMTFIES